MKAVNVELEKLEDRNAKLPNGEIMDLWSLREQIVMYCTSLEGDEYVSGPAFLSPGDAMLFALNPMYRADTIGFATPEYPSNNPLTPNFRYNSLDLASLSFVHAS